MKIAEPIRVFMASDFDPEDLWGWANGHMFGLCAVLYATESEIPREWEYRHSPVQSAQELLTHFLDAPDDCCWPDSEYFDMARRLEISHDDLRHAGNVLVRYMRLLKHAGKDY